MSWCHSFSTKINQADFFWGTILLPNCVSQELDNQDGSWVSQQEAIVLVLSETEYFHINVNKADGLILAGWLG